MPLTQLKLTNHEMRATLLALNKLLDQKPEPLELSTRPDLRTAAVRAKLQIQKAIDAEMDEPH